MQDAAQYGAVEASSPPPPPKRVGRKIVVALAALGLAGVAALSLGPTKKTGTGLVARPPPKMTGTSKGKTEGCQWWDAGCGYACATNPNNFHTKRCCHCFEAPKPPGPDCTRRSPIGGFLEDCPTLCQPWRSSVNAPYTKPVAASQEFSLILRLTRAETRHRRGVVSIPDSRRECCTCPNCYRQSPIGSGGMETCPQLCAGNLITSRYAKECDDLCGNQPVALMA